ncbi:hypothetical protein V8C37DRAFT_376778 [Trichoderma ceciliae]
MPPPPKSTCKKSPVDNASFFLPSSYIAFLLLLACPIFSLLSPILFSSSPNLPLFQHHHCHFTLLRLWKQPLSPSVASLQSFSLSLSFFTPLLNLFFQQRHMQLFLVRHRQMDYFNSSYPKTSEIVGQLSHAIIISVSPTISPTYKPT